MEDRNIKVLIIEDDEFVSMLYMDQLEGSPQMNFEVEMHALLQPGLDRLDQEDFDVMLLDLNLPDSAYENTISKIPEISDRIPIIVMTSTNDESLALRTMNMGAQDYLIKDRLDNAVIIRSMLYGIERHRLKLELKRAKAKSDELLLNILPQNVIDEIKEFGVAKARSYQEATILFTDFVQFTSISEKLQAPDLVEEIDACFRAFDAITEKYGIEKIKTIGDAYMAVAGVPVPTEDGAKNAVLAGLEMQDFIIERALMRESIGKPSFQMRLGLHTGPVVAGVVGVKKFQYDIWGDTVNTASRMESCGIAGKVNISESTYDLVKSSAQFSFEHRGKVQAKGKGEMEMYFVERS